MARNIKESFKTVTQGTLEATNRVGRKARKIVTDAGTTISDKYEASGLEDKVDKFRKRTKEQIDRTGLPTAAKTVLEETSNVLDTVSGQKILESMEKRSVLQDKYNDILATKLAEALRRIEALEKLFAKAPSS